jgi:hypothetical protein
MTTRLLTILDGIYAAVEAVPDFPAGLERSTVRAFTREQSPMLVMHLGREVVSSDSPFPMADRMREILCSVHARGEQPDVEAEGVFEALQPLIMRFTAPGVIQIDEASTDEPKFRGADLSAVIITKRFVVTYRTLADSLSQ